MLFSSMHVQMRENSVNILPQGLFGGSHIQPSVDMCKDIISATIRSQRCDCLEYYTLESVNALNFTRPDQLVATYTKHVLGLVLFR